MTQEHLPEMEPEKIPTIHNAAMNYADAREEHKEATLRKNGAEEKLITAMQAAGKTVYVYGDITVKLKSSNSVGVRIKSADEDGEDDED